MNPALVIAAFAAGGATLGVIVGVARKKKPLKIKIPSGAAEKFAASGDTEPFLPRHVMEVAQTGPTVPGPDYIYDLIRFAARSKGSEGKAARQAHLTDAEFARQAGDVGEMWSILWRLTRQGLYGKGSHVGMSQSQRDDEINAIVTNLIAFELFWRQAGTDQERVRNLFHRYQYIVTRIKALKVRAKYGMRLHMLVVANGCSLVVVEGPSWGKFLTSGGFVIPVSMSVSSNCDVQAFMKRMAHELTYAIGQTAVMSINAAEYVGYDFGDLMAGVASVGTAFAADF